jgi:hypothetical protein
MDDIRGKHDIAAISSSESERSPATPSVENAAAGLAILCAIAVTQLGFADHQLPIITLAPPRDYPLRAVVESF